MIKIPGQDIWFRGDQLLSMQILQEDGGWELLIVCAYSQEPFYLRYESQLAAQSVAQAIAAAVHSNG